MAKRRNWIREELVLAINVYCKIPFGQIHSRNPRIVRLAGLIDRSPNSVSYKLANFASIDPSLARKGASHFSKLDLAVWKEFFNDWEKLAYESELLRVKYEQGELASVAEFRMPEGRDRESIVKTRVNQSFFRETILAAYDSKCCITNISIPELLVASHIVPWSKDKKNRLNPRNGLCLNALHDRAFDGGLITLSDDYRVLVSRHLQEKCSHETERIILLDFNNRRISLPNRFLPDKEFITYHRRTVFVG